MLEGGDRTSRFEKRDFLVGEGANATNKVGTPVDFFRAVNDLGSSTLVVLIDEGCTLSRTPFDQNRRPLFAEPFHQKGRETHAMFVVVRFARNADEHAASPYWSRPDELLTPVNGVGLPFFGS